MRGPSKLTAQSTYMTADISNIAPSAALTINIAFNTNSKSRPKKATKYRAVQRADGVVVEHPQYQPPNAPRRTDFTFEGKPLLMEEVSRANPSKSPLSSTMNNDLLGIGTFLADQGRDGYNTTLDCCSTGVHEDMYATSIDESDLLSLDASSCSSLDAMDRFILGSDAWSTLSRRM
ncbi:hypothetical protein J1614_011442 [Plenodomus biglobosus]|nr:hypothetical protein J1614_011442 [Plenodomus biglobosus]